MPKAVVAMKSGSTVTIEGSSEEVAALVSRLDGGQRPGAVPAKSQASTRQKAKPTLTGLVEELDCREFRKPKELGAVKVALEERGQFYPTTTLSPIMLRFVKRREHVGSRKRNTGLMLHDRRLQKTMTKKSITEIVGKIVDLLTSLSFLKIDAVKSRRL